ncbi:MAG TPA: GNAT family N-acetyltransferase [Vicinamibacterales bacterium]|jgi:GNAT superfamily N-acetyltransferase|nr:GNAT family N-acetyltransferase [Vicinamibacterales bacterium]|tara:strand:+ start:422 stop:892 length:471 start_codon:yes stop_codon:yes gene_type:complete
MAVSTRLAVDADRPGICNVHVRAIRATCSSSYSAEQISSWAGLLSPDSYTTVIRDRVFVVATDHAAVVGFGQLDPSSGDVEAVYVLPARQGEGIGQGLLSYLEDSARLRGVATLGLSATLNATLFYERAGYSPCGPIVHKLPTGVELQCIRMTKQL